MKRSKWRARFRRSAENHEVASWLTEPGSLTARCQAASKQFRVSLLHYGFEQPLADEGIRFHRQRGRAWVREVMLECDGVPVIFAHTVLPAAPHGRLSAWLARLGNRSLGSLLFTHPGFGRGTIEILRLDSRHPLYRKAAAVGEVDGVLWARRSLHRLGRQAVLVTEVFLPAIARLENRRPSAPATIAKG